MAETDPYRIPLAIYIAALVSWLFLIGSDLFEVIMKHDWMSGFHGRTILITFIGSPFILWTIIKGLKQAER